MSKPAKLATRPRPATYDHALRYWVASHTVEGKLYLVEIDAYGFNGTCQCKNFAIHFEPLLLREIPARDAVAGELVELRPGQRPEDALRCIHIVDAFMALAEDFARTIRAAEEKAATQFNDQEASEKTKATRDRQL